MSRKRGYQHRFSEDNPAMFDIELRERKAGTIVSVLGDFIDEPLEKLDLVNIGSSTGIIDNMLSMHFRSVTGVDIDTEAIGWAHEHFRRDNLRFVSGDAMDLPFEDGSIDVAVSSHVYEHVPDAGRMFREIYRVLRPGGVCYFAANNRIALVEPHYGIPLLSLVPRPLASLVLRISGRGDHYYEKHRSYRGLLSLVSDFDLHDYTRLMVAEPEKFSTGYMIRPGSLRAKMAGLVVKYCYPLSPGYIWLLRKP